MIHPGPIWTLCLQSCVRPRLTSPRHNYAPNYQFDLDMVNTRGRKKTTSRGKGRGRGRGQGRRTAPSNNVHVDISPLDALLNDMRAVG